MTPPPLFLGVYALGTAFLLVVVGGVGLVGFRILSDDGDDESDPTENLDDVHLDEVAYRLEQDDEPITGENLRERVAEIEQEKGKSERESRTGAERNFHNRGKAQKLSIAPDKIIEGETYVRRTGEYGDEKYARSLIVSSFPNRVAFGWLDSLFTSAIDVRVSYHIWPRDPDTMMRKLNIRATRLQSRIQRKREEGKVNTTEEENQLEHINRLRQGLTEGSTKVFDFALYMEVLADSEEELEEATGQVKQVFAQSNARVTPLYDRQLEAQRAIAPLGNDPIRKTQIMDTEALGTTFPFIEPSIVQPEGVLVGFHNTTSTPVVVDRFALSGHNMLISGKIGSGKSYLAKLNVWRRLQMDPEVDVLIIDPVGGMTDLVEALAGQQVVIGGDSTINPMELREAAGAKATGDPYEQKLRSVMGMFKSHFQGKRELGKEEEGILRRAIRIAYLKRGITPDVSTHGNESPTIQDVLDVLKAMADGKKPRQFDVPDDVSDYLGAIETTVDDEDGESSLQDEVADYAHSVWLGLEDFQEGGQNNNLNGDTNVELQNRVVQFDLSAAVDKGSAPLLMHVVLDWLFQRAKQSDGRTMVVIDEAHYMLGQDQALDMLELFARHSRHYNAGMTLISQTVDEFMRNDKAKAIYDQCDLRALMRHEHIGDDALEALDLTERERRFVLQAQAGNSAAFSECLFYVTDIGKIWLRVISNDFEHHVIDGGESAWAFLYGNDMVEWDEVPEHKQHEVRQQMQQWSSS